MVAALRGVFEALFALTLLRPSDSSAAVQRRTAVAPVLLQVGASGKVSGQSANLCEVFNAIVEKHNRYEQPLYDDSGYLRTPANMTASMYFPDCASRATKEEMAKFNGAQPWEMVKFTSRQGKLHQQVVEIAAWWLPVAGQPDAPRIVLQHGNNVNANDWTVMLSGYMLRSMGFAVLLPNLRDHGHSVDTKNPAVRWGWDYHLDVLAAVDYAIHDPHGTLGGPMPAGKVGLMGFSMGAFVAAIAFGLESNVAGLWLDSPVFEPQNILEDRARALVPDDALRWMVSEFGWNICAMMAAGVNLDYMTPAKVLPTASSSAARPVAVAHALGDSAVPVTEGLELLQLFFKHQDLYRVHMAYLPNVTCGYETHPIIHLVQPDKYREHLCRFWSKAFDRDERFCGLGALPSLL